MVLHDPNRSVKSLRDPANLDEVIGAEAQKRGFVRRVAILRSVLFTRSAVIASASQVCLPNFKPGQRRYST
jgi:hypothetical protein